MIIYVSLFSFSSSAEEGSWAVILRNGITFGGGAIEPAELYKVINKRVERVTMRTVSFYCTISYYFSICFLEYAH